MHYFVLISMSYSRHNFTGILMIVTGVVTVVLAVSALVILFFRLRGNEPVSEATSEKGLAVKNRFKDRAVTIAFAHLAGWMIKKKSRDPKKKLAFVKEYFATHFPDDAAYLENELQRALEYSIHIRSAAGSVNRKMRAAADRKQLIDFLIGLAFADGDINEREYVALARFGDLTGVRMGYLEKSVLEHREKFHPGSGRNAAMDLLSNFPYKRKKALDRLGLPAAASESEIRKTYRRLAKLHHPDKFMQETEEERRKNEEVFREIREAYEFLIS